MVVTHSIGLSHLSAMRTTPEMAARAACAHKRAAMAAALSPGPAPPAVRPAARTEIVDDGYIERAVTTTDGVGTAPGSASSPTTTAVTAARAPRRCRPIGSSNLPLWCPDLPLGP
jgi:hypothetical protein